MVGQVDAARLDCDEAHRQTSAGQRGHVFSGHEALRARQAFARVLGAPQIIHKVGAVELAQKLLACRCQSKALTQLESGNQTRGNE